MRDCTAGSSDTLRRSVLGTGPAASSQDTNEGLCCCSATSEIAASAAIVKVEFRIPSRKSCVLNVACNNTAGGCRRAGHPSAYKASPANSGAESLQVLPISLSLSPSPSHPPSLPNPPPHTLPLSLPPSQAVRHSAYQESALNTCFSSFPEMTPFPTLPGRKLACPRGGRLRNGLQTSEWQGLAHLAGSTPAGSLPSFYDSREKFVHFGLAQPGRARLFRARACRGQNSDFKKKIVSKCQAQSRGLPAVLRLRNSDF